MPNGLKKSRVLAALACLLAVALAGCSLFSGSEASTETEPELVPTVQTPVIKQDGVLRVAILTSAGAPEVIEQSDGTYVGLDVDVAAALAQQLGLKVEYVACEHVTQALSEDVDVIMGVDSSASAKLTVVSHYMESALGFFSKGDAPYVATLDQIDAGKIAVQAGSTAEKTLDTTNITSEQVACLNLNEAFKDLDEGSADFVLCSAYPGGYLAAQEAGVVFAGTLDVAATKGVGVLATNTDLATAVQQAMDTITTNGVIDILRARWVGDMPVLGADTQVQGVEITGTSEAADTVDEEVGTSTSLEIGSNAVVSLD
jgi:polar amino acid transport system substrate-binding protein